MFPDFVSTDAIQKIVELVEVKWKEVEVEQLKAELSRKDDKITDLTLEFETRRQELIDIIDKELLCSICSEILNDVSCIYIYSCCAMNVELN